MKNPITNFIESHRQQGTSTALIACTLEHNGYLIVANQLIKKQRHKDHPTLNVLTIEEIKHGARGFAGPIFFDTDAIQAICQSSQQTSIQENFSLDFTPTSKDLEIWKELFEASRVDPDFVVIKHDGYQSATLSKSEQLNVKMTEDDMQQILDIKKDFFDNEVSNSTLGRILIRKGIQFYKKLKNSI